MLALELDAENIHVKERCTRTVCALAQMFEEPEEYTVHVGTESHVFVGCPVAHADPDVAMWISLYDWCKRWETTPVREGLVSANRLDPRFWDAMELVDSVVSRKKPSDR